MISGIIIFALLLLIAIAIYVYVDQKRTKPNYSLNQKEAVDNVSHAISYLHDTKITLESLPESNYRDVYLQSLCQHIAKLHEYKNLLKQAHFPDTNPIPETTAKISAKIKGLII
jgi:hypothetical protein